MNAFHHSKSPDHQKVRHIVTKPACVVFLAFCCILASCSKQREISGEVFSRDFQGKIVKEAGTLVWFLTAQEHERLEALAKDARDRQYQRDRDLWNRSNDEYRELFDKQRKREDGKVYESDAGKEVMDKLRALETVISRARANIDEKVYDRGFHFDDEGEEQVKQLLAYVHQATADSEGKFKVILSFGAEYWVLAEAEISSLWWYFRYVPDGTPLILSGGNATQR